MNLAGAGSVPTITFIELISLIPFILFCMTAPFLPLHPKPTPRHGVEVTIRRFWAYRCEVAGPFRGDLWGLKSWP